MKIDYHTPLQVITNSLQHYHHITVNVEEIFGIDFFPSNDVVKEGDRTSYTLQFNPRLQDILILYNLALERGYDTGKAIVHYTLFYAFLETDNYDAAHRHLDAFRAEIANMPASMHSSEEQTEDNGQLLIQLYFTLFHEAFHIIFRHNPEARKASIDTTRELLKDIKNEWEDLKSMMTDEELLNHPRIQQSIADLVPQALSQEEQEAWKEGIRKNMSAEAFPASYIDEVLAGDDSLLEEISCDRQAWLNLLPLFQENAATTQEILHLHLYMFAVFNAMDYNKNLMSELIPAKHIGYQYNGRRVVLRHKAFKALLRQYSPEVDKEIKTEYNDLQKGLSSIFQSSIMALYQYGKELHQMYMKNDEIGNLCPNFAESRALNEEMDAIVRTLREE